MLNNKIDRPLNQYKKSELNNMFLHAIIDKCPICNKYHIKKDKPIFPMANIWVCDECKKRLKNKNKWVIDLPKKENIDEAK